jgi:glycosyltransferase involved in cell wall biosynthesis
MQCDHVIVIDDGSTDGTADALAGLPVRLIRHATPGGKGNALRAGFGAALERDDVDGVLTMDGDGQHAPEDLPRILRAAALRPGSIVVGARLIGRERQPAMRRVANDIADWGIAWAVGQRLVDSQSGQRWYPRDVVALAPSLAQGFVFEADILIEAARRLGTRVVAVPIESRYEGEFRASHFKPLRDFCRITSHVIGRVVEAGGVVASYRRARATAAEVIDPDA